MTNCRIHMSESTFLFTQISNDNNHRVPHLTYEFPLYLDI